MTARRKDIEQLQQSVAGSLTAVTLLGEAVAGIREGLQRLSEGLLDWGDLGVEPHPEMAIPTEPPLPVVEDPPGYVDVAEVRGLLAAKVQDGFGEQVRGLIGSYGVEKLTDVPEDRLAELLAKAEAFGNG